MKIKSYAALSLVGCMVVALGLGSMSTLADDKIDKSVSMDPENAVQHIVNVKVCGAGENIDCSIENASILKLAGKQLVGVQTNNFIISQTESDKINTIDEGSNFSNILGGSNNELRGLFSTILGGEGNINNGNHSTILGGSGNKISGGKNSVIVGGLGNVLEGDNSVIVGGSMGNNVNGDYSAVLGNNSSVNGNNSVALGKKSKVNANNSFLWTDGLDREELTTDNVFVVKSTHGMVVNTGAAHRAAQLTIGGPLVIHEGGNATCRENSEDAGVVKVIGGDNGYKCFCGCDGRGYWHSLYGQGRCEGYCNGSDERKPGCAAGSIGDGVGTWNWVPKDGMFVFSGSCNEYSKPVVGTGAYVVENIGIMHRTCQTDAGLTASCHD